MITAPVPWEPYSLIFENGYGVLSVCPRNHPISVYSVLELCTYHCAGTAGTILCHYAWLVGFDFVFHMGSGIKFRYSCLQGKTLFNWAIAPALIYAYHNRNKTVISIDGYAQWLLYCPLKGGESYEYITKSRKLKYLQVTGLEQYAVLGSSQLWLRQLYNSHHLSITEGQNQSL